MPKTPIEIKSLARAHTKGAIATLRGVMNNTKAPAAARVSAAQALLDRGWGKAVQPLAGADGDGPVEIKLIERVVVDPQNTDS